MTEAVCQPGRPGQFASLHVRYTARLASPHLYADVALPVPLDQAFTYSLPETLRHRVQPGARVTAPFGPRKLTGVVVETHDDKPEHQTRDILTLVDEEPALHFALQHI